MYTIVAEKRNKEIESTMLKAREAKYSVPIRYGKVLFCGAAAAGKSNFLNLLIKEDFQPLHISTEVLKPQQVTIAVKAVILSNESEVEFKKMSINKEILELESYLPKKYTAPLQKSSLQANIQYKPSADNNLPKRYTSKAPSQKASLQDDNQSADNLPKKYTTFTAPLQKSSAHNSKLALATVAGTKKLDDKQVGAVWNILTFMDTGGQPQFISMLPAVNSFAMITFIIHKMEKRGQISLKNIAKVPYGHEKEEISYKPHPHDYTYLQLIETLISYASNILRPDTTFLDKVKDDNKKYEGIDTRSISLAGTHSGEDQLLEEDIKSIDVELTKVVKKSGIKYIISHLNKNYQILVPVDNKKQGKSSEIQVTDKNSKRYTDPSDIRRYIHKFLNNQDTIHVPIKWLLLELEIRKVCEQKNCNLISYDHVLKLAKERKLGYNGEFGEDIHIDDERFIKQGLRFHHSFGVLLYFENVEGMQNLVITNHQWLFNKLSKIVEYSFTCNYIALKDIEDLKKGVFRKSLLGSDYLDVIKDFLDSQIDLTSVNPVNAFLKLIEYLRIAAPLNENATKYFMPFLLPSFELNDFKQKYYENKMKPLLIQFKSNDNETCSFPMGAFCFLVVELMLTKKWEPYGQTYVNLITLIKKDTAHHITLADNTELFCLEIHVTHDYEKPEIMFNEVREYINTALHAVAGKLRIYDNLCHGFPCSCKEVHIAYYSPEDSRKYCYCKESGSPVQLTSVHRYWFESVSKVGICMYLYN